jgi:hypothetical protein
MENDMPIVTGNSLEKIAVKDLIPDAPHAKTVALRCAHTGKRGLVIADVFVVGGGIARLRCRPEHAAETTTPAEIGFAAAAR